MQVTWVECNNPDCDFELAGTIGDIDTTCPRCHAGKLKEFNPGIKQAENKYGGCDAK